MRKIITVTLVMLAITILTGCGGGGGGGTPPTPTGDLSGTVLTIGVVDPDTGSFGLDVPVEGVNVKVEGTSLSTTTGTDGKFAISGLGTGTYYLVFTKQGYQQSRQQVISPKSGLTFRINKDTGSRPDLPMF